MPACRMHARQAQSRNQRNTHDEKKCLLEKYETSGTKRRRKRREGEKRGVGYNAVVAQVLARDPLKSPGLARFARGGGGVCGKAPRGAGRAESGPGQGGGPAPLARDALGLARGPLKPPDRALVARRGPGSRRHLARPASLARVSPGSVRHKTGAAVRARDRRGGCKLPSRASRAAPVPADTRCSGSASLCCVSACPPVGDGSGGRRGGLGL